MYLGSPDVDWSREMLVKMKEVMEKAEAELPVPPEDPLPAMSLQKYVGDPGEFALFQADPKGVITSVTVTPLNEDGCGVFEPITTSPRRN